MTRRNPRSKFGIVFVIIIIAGFFYVSGSNKTEISDNNEGTTLESEKMEDAFSKEELKPQGGGNNEEVKEDILSNEGISGEEKAVRAIVLNFEEAYKAKNISGMFGYFTDPVNQNDKDVKGRLIDGKDTEGNIGGPTLFQTNTASDIPESFGFTEVKKEGEGYIIKIQENRKSSTGSTALQTRYLKLVNVEGRWKIDKYYSDSYSEKYSGFLSF